MDECFPWSRWTFLDVSTFLTFFGVSVYLSVAISRRLYSCSLAEKSFHKLRQALDPALERHDLESALASCQSFANSPVAAVAAATLQEIKGSAKLNWTALERVKQAGRRSGLIQITRLSDGLSDLWVASLVVLLLGLLCACSDATRAFEYLRYLEGPGIAAISWDLTHALWPLLPAPALAMIAILFHRHFRGKVDSARLQIERVQIDILQAYLSGKRKRAPDQEKPYPSLEPAAGVVAYRPESWMGIHEGPAG